MLRKLFSRGRALLAAFGLLLCLSFASSAAATSQTRYPLAIERNFINSCVSHSFGNVSGCRCALRRIEATVTLRAFKAYDRALVNGTAPNLRTAAKLRAAFAWCI
jgi:hypothetical protein